MPPYEIIRHNNWLINVSRPEHNFQNFAGDISLDIFQFYGHLFEEATILIKASVDQT